MTQQQDDTPFCPSPDPHPRSPTFAMPAGACDTHFHIFPAGHEHRYVPDRSYTPPPLELSDFDHVALALGIERGVVVQASVYGEDNAATLAASAAEPDRLRAVISVTKDVTDAELEAFHAQGARGIRVNVVDSGGMTFAQSTRHWHLRRGLRTLAGTSSFWLMWRSLTTSGRFWPRYMCLWCSGIWAIPKLPRV